MMAEATYSFTLQSKEDRGSTKPNIIQVELASDDDADVFAANLEVLCSAVCVSWDKVMASDYSLPYGAGNSRVFRCACWSDPGTGMEFQMTVRDVKADADPNAFAAALVTAGLAFPEATEIPVTQVNINDIRPQYSVV